MIKLHKEKRGGQIIFSYRSGGTQEDLWVFDENGGFISYNDKVVIKLEDIGKFYAGNVNPDDPESSVELFCVLKNGKIIPLSAFSLGVKKKAGEDVLNTIELLRFFASKGFTAFIEGQEEQPIASDLELDKQSTKRVSLRGLVVISFIAIVVFALIYLLW